MTDETRYSDELLDTILDGRPLAPDAPRQLVLLADRLAGLAGPQRAGELAGEAAALAAFSQHLLPDGPGAGPAPGTLTRRLVHRRRHGRTRARLATVITAVLVVVSGTAAAYAGVLPPPVQQFAHRVIGAPAAHSSSGHQRGQHQRPAKPGLKQAESSGHGKSAAEHGRGKARSGHGQQARHGKPATKTKKAHPAHPAGQGTQDKS